VCISIPKTSSSNDDVIWEECPSKLPHEDPNCRDFIHSVGYSEEKTEFNAFRSPDMRGSPDTRKH
jgi:hypothetical protein